MNATTYYMSRRQFEDESERRQMVARYREKAAQTWGLHGRITFRWHDFHGRPKRIVEVRIEG